MKNFHAMSFATILLVAALPPTVTATERSDNGPLDPKFFAHAEIEAEAPEAFVLQRMGLPSLDEIARQAPTERKALIAAIRADKKLFSAITRFPHLNWDERISVLKYVFALECEVLGIRAPELIFDSERIRGAAYFDFDPEKPDAGRVILNPKALAKEENPYTALLLLIHETRHSAQFQAAFSNGAASKTKLAQSYRAAFRAQLRLKGRLSFVDFLSLFNEFEAFQFANYVVGALTNWTVREMDMGTFASQYDEHGHLKIDLLALARESEGNSLLDAFNELEKEQYRLLKR